MNHGDDLQKNLCPGPLPSNIESVPTTDCNLSRTNSTFATRVSYHQNYESQRIIALIFHILWTSKLFRCLNYKDSCDKYVEWTEGLDMRLIEMMTMMIHAHFLAGHNKAFFYILRYSDASICILSTFRV